MICRRNGFSDLLISEWKTRDIYLLCHNAYASLDMTFEDP